MRGSVPGPQDHDRSPSHRQPTERPRRPTRLVLSMRTLGPERGRDASKVGGQAERDRDWARAPAPWAGSAAGGGPQSPGIGPVRSWPGAGPVSSPRSQVPSIPAVPTPGSLLSIPPALPGQGQRGQPGGYEPGTNGSSPSPPAPSAVRARSTPRSRLLGFFTPWTAGLGARHSRRLSRPRPLGLDAFARHLWTPPSPSPAPWEGDGGRGGAKCARAPGPAGRFGNDDLALGPAAAPARLRPRETPPLQAQFRRGRPRPQGRPRPRARSGSAGPALRKDQSPGAGAAAGPAPRRPRPAAGSCADPAADCGAPGCSARRRCEGAGRGARGAGLGSGRRAEAPERGARSGPRPPSSHGGGRAVPPGAALGSAGAVRAAGALPGQPPRPRGKGRRGN